MRLISKESINYTNVIKKSPQVAITTPSTNNANSPYEYNAATTKRANNNRNVQNRQNQSRKQVVYNCRRAHQFYQCCDLNEKCPAYANEYNYCRMEGHENFMKQSCPQSCGFC